MRKKLIEVALPLGSINTESSREKSIRKGHPSTLHLWWSRKPLASSRGILFAQLVDDPSAWPEHFPTEEDQRAERDRLHGLLNQLVCWESTTDSELLNAAKLEIARSIARGRRADGRGVEADRRMLDGASAREVDEFLTLHGPRVLDPFAGGGSIPLEACRLGLRAKATDLNPVAVVITKALIEVPARFGHRQPALGRSGGVGGHAIAADLRALAVWMRDEAKKRIGAFYPEVEVPKEHGGGSAKVLAWLWVRTVPSPDPAFDGVQVPLASKFHLSTKKGKEAWVQPIVDGKEYRFEVRHGAPQPQDRSSVEKGTSAGRGANFTCLVSGSPIGSKYLRERFKRGETDVKLLAIVAEGKRQRLYLSPTEVQETAARSAEPSWAPSQEMNQDCKDLVSGRGYGISHWRQLFSPRQLLAMTTFSDLIPEARARAIAAAKAAGWDDDGLGFDEGGAGATAYADALAIYLALAVDRAADAWSNIVTWTPQRETFRNTFARQAIPMMWEYAEGNPFSSSAGSFTGFVEWISAALERLPTGAGGVTELRDAASALEGGPFVVSTDPPYYDNIGYGDVSDFFYVWLRHNLRNTLPSVFSTILVPKEAELVAAPHRHESKRHAEVFFTERMTEALQRTAEASDPAYPATIYYAFKQTESSAAGRVSTGWEAFLEALLRAGFSVTGTWPVRTERASRSNSINTNALASSIVLVCRRRPEDAPTATRREFIRLLRSELPNALRVLQQENNLQCRWARRRSAGLVGPNHQVVGPNHQVLVPCRGSLRWSLLPKRGKCLRGRIVSACADGS